VFERNREIGCGNGSTTFLARDANKYKFFGKRKTIRRKWIRCVQIPWRGNHVDGNTG